jgi:arginase family enzyme
MIPRSAPGADEGELAIGDLIGRDLRGDEVPAAVLIGCPVDEGVRRNHGRAGAAEAPAAIRGALLRTPAGDNQGLRALIARVWDAGDLSSTGVLERDQDAHADVRELKNGLGHSGSPFRQAILHESGLCRRYTVAGLLPDKVLPAHLDFITAHAGAFSWKSDLTADRLDATVSAARAAGTSLMVSFDMDAVDAGSAPGVSAPSAGGLSPDLWLRAAEAAGRHPEVASMDLVEVNPTFDPDGRTIDLAALTIRRFLQGLAARNASAGRYAPALREVSYTWPW